MSTIQDEKYDGGSYHVVRPSYDTEFVDYLVKHGAQNADLIVDVGCGPGTATHLLAKAVKSGKVIGMDSSKSMIDAANQVYADIANLEFIKGSDRDLVNYFKPSSVDLITSAEAAHWFEYPAFFDSVSTILKPGGKLALFGYINPHIVGFPKVDELVKDFSFSSDKLGPYWDNGIDKIVNLYDDLEFPKSLKVTVRDKAMGYDPHYNTHRFKVQKDMKVGQFLCLLKSYSAYFTWKSKNPDPSKDIVDEFSVQLAKLGLEPDMTISVQWNTIVIIAEKVNE